MQIDILAEGHSTRGRTRRLLGFVSALLLVAAVAAACDDSPKPVSTISSQVTETSSAPSTTKAADSTDSRTEAGATLVPDSATSAPAPAISAPAAPSSAPAPPGPPSLDDTIFNTDVIAIVRPVSAEAGVLTVETKGKTHYNPVIQNRLEVVEYLKGDGGSEVVVDVVDMLYGVAFPSAGSVVYSSAGQALEVAESNLAGQRRDMVGEEGVIFLSSSLNLDAFNINIMDTSLKNETEYMQVASQLRIYSTEGKLDSASTILRLGSESDESAKEVSVGELRERIEAMDSLLREGDGIEGYEDCIKLGFQDERYRRGFVGGVRDIEPYRLLQSGLPAGAVLHSYTMSPARQWLTGDNAHLFDYSATQVSTTRPLPAGAYEVNAHFQKAEWVVCDYTPHPSIWRYTFKPANDVLHEAFFDPVETGGVVGVSGDNGVLKPNGFEADDGETYIGSIEWQDGQVEMVKIDFPQSSGLSGYRADFIAMDGSVSLRLDFDDANESVANNDTTTTLTWGVCEQPWEDGDLLMLRIAEGAPDDGVQATSDSNCGDSSKPVSTNSSHASAPVNSYGSPSLGEGIAGYEECVEAMLLHENFRRKYRESLSSVYDVESAPSGLPAGSIIDEFTNNYPKQWFTGVNAHLFHYGENKITITRPMPAGAYEVNAHFQEAAWMPCDYEPPPVRWRYTFEPANNVLHEAFFDPVDIGDAVGAGGDNGVLRPDEYESHSQMFRHVIESIKWQDDQVKMKLSLGAYIHYVDFIAPDGSVSLRLWNGDASITHDAGDGSATLTWGVCEQPWVEGVLLMLRLRNANNPTDDGVVVTNDYGCPGEASESGAPPVAPATLIVIPSATEVPAKRDGTTFSNPLPHDVKFEAGVFDMQITAVDRDAWPKIQAEKPSNEAPALGYDYVMWTISVENVRGSSTEYAQLITESSFNLSGSYGLVYRPLGQVNGCGTIPNELFGLLHLGDKTEGNVCFSVPTDETDLTLRYSDNHYGANHTAAVSDYIRVVLWFRAEEPSGRIVPIPRSFWTATTTCGRSGSPEVSSRDGEVQASDVDGYISKYNIEITSGGQLFLYVNNFHTAGCDTVIVSFDGKTLKRTNGTVVEDRYTNSCFVYGDNELKSKETYAVQQYDFDLPRTNFDLEPINEHPLTALGKQVCAGTVPPPAHSISLYF